MPAFIKPILVALLGAGVTLAFVSYARPAALPSASGTREQAPARSDDPWSGMQAKVARLQRAIERLAPGERADELRSLREHLRQLEQRIDAVANPEHRDGEVDPKLSEDDLRAIERAHTDVLIASLDEHFDNEARNAAWADATEASIASSLQAETGLVPRSVSCQSRLCRVEMEHTDPEAESLFMHKLVHVRELGDTEAFSERREREDGTVATTTYLAGNGRRLPEAPVL